MPLFRGSIHSEVSHIYLICGMTTCSCWSAAAEALTAFLKSYVVPISSLDNKEILLQLVLSYLSGYTPIPVIQCTLAECGSHHHRLTYDYEVDYL